MYKKKISVIVLSAALSVTSFSSFANATDNGPVYATPTSDSPAAAKSGENVIEPYFNSFSGTAKKISKTENGSKMVFLESSDKKETNMIISKDTYVVNGDALTVGASATGYYDANAPALMIYPPQYQAEVFVVESKNQIVKVDVFNKDLISSDNFLKLNIADSTEVITPDGSAYKGELANRKLAVIYKTSTKSIPAQTTPIKVVVLPEKTIDPSSNPEKVMSMDILVNGNKVSAPSAYVNEQGVVMVPVSAIGEALGFKLSWDRKTKTVMLGQGISLTVGNDYYVYMKTAPIQLGTSPVILGNKTYVPLNFFTEVAKAKSARLTETQILIDN